MNGIKRNTVQRQIVLEALQKLNTHPAIEGIYAEIRKEHPAISKTTVYRNLRKLADCGIIRQISLPDGLERYDKCAGQHYHFRCKDCGHIFDVDIEHFAGVNDIVREKYGFQVDGHEVVFTGVCLKCGNNK